jgi:hypothetical protein
MRWFSEFNDHVSPYAGKMPACLWISYIRLQRKVYETDFRVSASTLEAM